MGGYAPRALERLCARGAWSGASGRPLNFTVRRQLGALPPRGHHIVKTARFRVFLALLALSVGFYVADCFLVLFISKNRPDVPWYESGIYAARPFGFSLSVAMFVFAFVVLLFGKDR